MAVVVLWQDDNSNSMLSLLMRILEELWRESLDCALREQYPCSGEHSEKNQYLENNVMVPTTKIIATKDHNLSIFLFRPLNFVNFHVLYIFNYQVIDHFLLTIFGLTRPTVASEQGQQKLPKFCLKHLSSVCSIKFQTWCLNLVLSICTTFFFFLTIQPQRPKQIIEKMSENESCSSYKNWE